MTFGKRVLGDEAWQEQQERLEQQRRQGLGLGPRVTGPLAPPKEAVATTEEPVTEPDVPEPEAPEAPSEEYPKDETEGDGSGAEPISITLVEMEKALKENQSIALFDQFYEAEFARPEGMPRKGALQLLLQAEKARGETARPAIIADLQAAIDRV